MFIGLLTNLVNLSDHTKYEPSSNQKFEIQPTNLHPNEWNQELHFYLFVAKLEKCVRSCNTLNDLFNKLCVSNKTEDLNTYVFNMITRKMNQKFNKRYIMRM